MSDTIDINAITAQVPTFINVPGIRMFIYTVKGEIVEVSDDIARGSITLSENAPHTFEMELINPKRKYDFIFTPNDRVVILLKRIMWLQVFSGYLDQVPYFSVYPRTVRILGTCALKKLKYWAFDPTTDVTQSLFQTDQGTMGQPGTTTGPTGQSDPTSHGDPSGGLQKLVVDMLTKIANYPPDKIHIGAIPLDWFQQAATLWGEIQPFLPLWNPQPPPSAATTGTPTSGTAGQSGKMFNDILSGIGAPPSQGNIEAMNAWAAAEGGALKCFNPFNTTKDAPGATSINSVGVKCYPDEQTGANALVSTLLQSNFAAIVDAFRGDKGCQAIGQAILSSPWGTQTFPCGSGSDWGTGGPFAVVVGPAGAAKDKVVETTATSAATPQGNSGGPWPGVAVQKDNTLTSNTLIADVAESQIGTSVLGGAEAPGVAFDAAGLVHWAVKTGSNIDLGRINQYDASTKLDITSAGRGDLIHFFDDSGEVNHVGIIIDGPPATMMVHAPSTGGAVRVDPIFPPVSPQGSTAPARDDRLHLGGRLKDPPPPPASPTDYSMYTNPLAQIPNLQPERIDMGVDYAGSGPLLAIGAGQILKTTQSGWPGGTFIALKLDAGPFAGSVIYYAENITPLINPGDHVETGNAIGLLIDAAPNMEIGWGDPNVIGNTLASSHGGYDGANSTACGVSFNNFLVALGAPSGNLQGNATADACPVNVTATGAAATRPGGGTPNGAPSDPGMLLNYYYTKQQDEEANDLTGVRALLNDDYLLNYIATVTNASMRSFCSAPNGDFIAWFPDYFGQYKVAATLTIKPIELQDFTMVWDDTNLKTHVFTAGGEVQNTPAGALPGSGDPVNLQDVLSTYGVATVDFPQILQTLFKNDDPNSVFASTQSILKRFGARPSYTPMGLIAHSGGPGQQGEFWYALRLFMENWSNQFSASIPTTFMPEAFPGMLVQLDGFNFQAYVKQVTHTIDFSDNGGGFQTNMIVTSPSNIATGGLLGLAKG